MDAELTSNYAVLIFKVIFHLCKHFQHLGKRPGIRSFLSSDSQTCHQLRHRRGLWEAKGGCPPPWELSFCPGHVAANILNCQSWQWQRGFPLDPRWSSWRREAPQFGCCQIPCSNQRRTATTLALLSIRPSLLWVRCCVSETLAWSLVCRPSQQFWEFWMKSLFLHDSAV